MFPLGETWGRTTDATSLGESVLWESGYMKIVNRQYTCVLRGDGPVLTLPQGWVPLTGGGMTGPGADSTAACSGCAWGVRGDGHPHANSPSCTLGELQLNF